MDLFAFAKGPLLEVSVSIFVLGVVWRLVGILLLREKKDLSAPRKPGWKGLRSMMQRSWPRKEFIGPSSFTEAISYTFHGGFFAVLFLATPHLLFFQDISRGLIGFSFRDVLGFGFPHLPGGILFALSGISVAALLFVLAHRLINPVKRLISNFDDYFSWFVTAAPFVTGMLAYSHFGGPYQTLLALHVLSIDLLLVWLPFGKLMHAFTLFAVRGLQGVLFERKGAAL